MFVDQFETLDNWKIYDSPGHAGRGRRTPSAVRTDYIDIGTRMSNVLSIVGDEFGNTGGLSLRGHPQKYGKWTVRMRSPKGAAAYHPVVMLWGLDRHGNDTAGVNNPYGEIDFVECYHNEDRNTNEFSLHYGDGQVAFKSLRINMTDWHTYSVNWSPRHIQAMVGDHVYYETSEVDKFPQTEMELAIQLDWFPDEGDSVEEPLGPGQLQVDWIKVEPYEVY